MLEPGTLKTRQIIAADYSAFILCLTSFLFLITVLALPFLLVTIPMLIHRVRQIRRTLQEGLTTSGSVKRVRFNRGYNTVWFSYQFQGETFEAVNKIPWYKKQVEENSTVKVRHSIEDPSRAFIQHYYTESATEFRSRKGK